MTSEVLLHEINKLRLHIISIHIDFCPNHINEWARKNLAMDGGSKFFFLGDVERTFVFGYASIPINLTFSALADNFHS